MEMTFSETSIHAQTEERITKSLENQTCLMIKTGSADCLAYFYPSLYQLTLLKAGIEGKVDLGFSGSRLLERLLQAPGEVVAREDLMSYAWSDRVVGQGSLNQQIYTLRQILGDEKERDIIQTLPRRGYMLNPKYIEVSSRPLPASEPIIEPETSLALNTLTDNATITPPGTAKTNLVASWNALWQLRLPVIVGVCSLVGFSAVLMHKQQPATTSNGTGLTLTYAPENTEQLIQLVPLGEAISEQLESQTSEPLQLVLGAHNEIVTLVCMRTDGSARSLHLHENQIPALSKTDLAPCL